MYNKIGVGLMAWGPLSMALGDAQNGDRLLFSKASFKTKSQSYSWTEDEINKNVSNPNILGVILDGLANVSFPTMILFRT